MMDAPVKKLSDQAALITALTAHDRSLLVEAGAGSGNPAWAKVELIWSSRSVRSVTITIAGFSAAAQRRNTIARNTMVSDLPDPCVWWITPPRSDGRGASRVRRMVSPQLLARGALLQRARARRPSLGRRR